MLVQAHHAGMELHCPFLPAPISGRKPPYDLLHSLRAIQVSKYRAFPYLLQELTRQQPLLTVDSRDLHEYSPVR